MNCLIQDVNVDGYRCKYPVLEECMQNERTEDRIFIVFFHRENHDVQCNCMLFELRGILCKHCLVVVAQERLEKVLSKYVFMRWSKNLRRRHTYIKASYTTGKEEAHIERYDTMCKRFCHIAEVACESEETTQNILQQLERMENFDTITWVRKKSTGIWATHRVIM